MLCCFLVLLFFCYGVVLLDLLIHTAQFINNTRNQFNKCSGNCQLPHKRYTFRRLCTAFHRLHMQEENCLLHHKQGVSQFHIMGDVCIHCRQEVRHS